MTESQTKTDNPGLSAAQERAIRALLTTNCQEEAARRCGLTSRTLYRYLQMPAFKEEYLRQRRELMAQAVLLAQRHALDMIAVQVVIAKDTTAPPSARISAASNVFNIADAGQKTEDLIERISKLEEIFHENVGFPGNKVNGNGAGDRRRR